MYRTPCVIPPRNSNSKNKVNAGWTIAVDECGQYLILFSKLQPAYPFPLNGTLNEDTAVTIH
jgi:hypothetical protein